MTFNNFVKFFIFIVFFTSFSVLQAFPTKILYKGTLTDSFGDPVNQDLSMTFRIYDKGQSIPLWIEHYDGLQGRDLVRVVKGRFQIMLGSNKPIPSLLFHNRDVELSIQIEDDQEMSPRIPFQAEVYAFQSENTIYFDSLKSSQFLRSDKDVALRGSMAIDNGVLAFRHTGTGQLIHLQSSDYGLGIQPFTHYFRSPSNFAWYIGGSHSDNALDPGVDGKVAMVIRQPGNFVGIGTSEPKSKLHVQGLITAEAFKGDVTLRDYQLENKKIADDVIDSRVIKNQSITVEDLADLSVSAEKIQDNVIDSRKILNKSITAQDIEDDSISFLLLAPDSVNSSRIVDNSIKEVDLANDSVSLRKLAKNAVDSSRIINKSILSDDIKNGEITTDLLADKSITSRKIEDGVVQNRDLKPGSFDSITGVGVLTSGAWESRPISIEYGGTSAKNVKDARENLGLGENSSPVFKNLELNGQLIATEASFDRGVEARYFRGDGRHLTNVSTANIARDALLFDGKPAEFYLAGKTSFLGELGDGAVPVWRGNKLVKSLLHVQKNDLMLNGNMHIGHMEVVTSDVKLTYYMIRSDGMTFKLSDERLMTKIQHLENPIASLESLKGVSFEWWDKSTQRGFENKRMAGVLVDASKEMFPFTFLNDKSSSFNMVSYEQIIPFLVEAIKDQDERLKALESEKLKSSQVLEKKIRHLELEVQKLRKLVLKTL